MSASTNPVQTEILELIGAIVLSTQEAEKYMKVVLPFTGSQDPSLTGALKRYEKLRMRTFGELTRKFADSSTSDSVDISNHLATLVEQRNQIVHHFDETYGPRLQAGEGHDVIAALREQLKNVDGFRDALAQMALQLLEAIRDTTFRGTAEQKDLAELCSALRKQISG